MAVKKSVKFIAVFIVIFVLGVITGAALMPVVFNKVGGNPYSIDVLSSRVYNTHILKNAGLTPDQVQEVDMLAAKYVLKYTAERDMFMAKRRTLYSEFKYELANILTREQFANYANKSDALISQREQYSKTMEEKWKEEHKKQVKERLADSGYKDKLKSITITIPAGQIMPENLQDADKVDQQTFDFLNRYMIDRVKNNWDTYKVYHEMNFDTIQLDEIEP